VRKPHKNLTTDPRTVTCNGPSGKLQINITGMVDIQYLFKG